VSLGPSGFPAYARLRFLPDPRRPGQPEADAPASTAEFSETEVLHRAVGLLAPFTTTPQECFFLLWDGWGIAAFDQGGGEPEGDERRDAAAAQSRSSAAPAEPGPAPGPRGARLRAPVVRLPHRSYHLFRGTTRDLGDWGPTVALRPHEQAPVPAFVWPADRAWCVTRDVDPHYAGVGAARAAVEVLVRDPVLDVVLADPAQAQPHYG